MRHAGFMVPLFSATSSRSWGIGELPDLVPLSAWLSSAGFDRLMILPIGVVAASDTSPYSAQSAMALDPNYIALDDLPDFVRIGGASSLPPALQRDLELARSSTKIEYDLVRRVKHEALSRAFDQFVRDEWEQLTTRAGMLAGYIARERWWLDEWAVYAAIGTALGSMDWRAWPEPLRDRQPEAIDEVRRHLAREVLRQQYLQWVAETQWQAARQGALANGVTVFGDMPFMVAAASPDVWSRRDEFMLDVSLGVPPDAFSDIGQDWALPMYRWDHIAPTGYAWIRERAKRMAALFGGFRVDHLVGWFRTYGKPPDGDPFFSPGDESSQLAQGETILRILIDSGAAIIAEDLGVVPPFVRQSLQNLHVPGCKVLRWERHWDAEGQPLVDPATFPPMSAAMTGTHDTESLAEWWTNEGDPSQPWSAAVRDQLLTSAFSAGSDDLFLPAQDVFGWTDRINVPATVGDHNWTWRLPWRVDDLGAVPEAVARAAFCRDAAGKSGRSPSPDAGELAGFGGQES